MDTNIIVKWKLKFWHIQITVALQIESALEYNIVLE